MALIQLFAYGASDVLLICRNEAEYASPYNLSDYNYCSFIDGKMDTTTDGSILHQSGIQLPFSIKKDKAASRIQQRWREAICNPSYRVCKDRLLREYGEMYNQ
jgi:hypothetical protein